MSAKEIQLALQIDTRAKKIAKSILKASGPTVRDTGNEPLARVTSNDDIPFAANKNPELRAVGIIETTRRTSD